MKKHFSTIGRALWVPEWALVQRGSKHHISSQRMVYLQWSTPFDHHRSYKTSRCLFAETQKPYSILPKPMTSWHVGGAGPRSQPPSFIHWPLVCVPQACYCQQSKEWSFKKERWWGRERKRNGCWNSSAYGREMVFIMQSPHFSPMDWALWGRWT